VYIGLICLSLLLPYRTLDIGGGKGIPDEYMFGVLMGDWLGYVFIIAQVFVIYQYVKNNGIALQNINALFFVLFGLLVVSFIPSENVFNVGENRPRYIHMGSGLWLFWLTIGASALVLPALVLPKTGLEGKELVEVKGKLLGRTVDYFKELKRKYVAGRERMTEIRTFDTVADTKVAMANRKPKRSLAKPTLWFTFIAVIVSGTLWVTLSPNGTESNSRGEESGDLMSSTQNSDINGPETNGLVASTSTVPEDSTLIGPTENISSDGTLLDEQLEGDSSEMLSTPAYREVIVETTVVATHKSSADPYQAPSPNQSEKDASAPVRSSLLASIGGENLEMLDEHYGFGVNGKRPRWQLGPGYSGNGFVAKDLSGGVLVLTTPDLTSTGHLTFWITNWPGGGYLTNLMPKVISDGHSLDVVVVGGALKEAWTQVKAGPLSPGHHKVTIEFQDGQSRSGMVRDYKVDDIEIWESKK